MRQKAKSILPRPWTSKEVSDSANWDFSKVETKDLATALEYELQRELCRDGTRNKAEIPPPFQRLVTEWAGIARTTFTPVPIPGRLRRSRPSADTFIAVTDTDTLKPAPESLLPPEQNFLGPGNEPSGTGQPGSGLAYQWPSHTVRSPEFGPRLLVAIDPRDLYWRLCYGNRSDVLKDLAQVCGLPEPESTKRGRRVDWPWLVAPVPGWVKVEPEELLKALGYLRLQSSGLPQCESWSRAFGKRLDRDSRNFDPESFSRNLNRQCDRIRVHLEGMRHYVQTPRTWIALKLADKYF